MSVSTSITTELRKIKMNAVKIVKALRRAKISEPEIVAICAAILFASASVNAPVRTRVHIPFAEMYGSVSAAAVEVIS